MTSLPDRDPNPPESRDEHDCREEACSACDRCAVCEGHAAKCVKDEYAVARETQYLAMEQREFEEKWMHVFGVHPDDDPFLNDDEPRGGLPTGGTPGCSTPTCEEG